MDELTSFSKVFKSALEDISALSWVSSTFSLRHAYTTLATRSLLPILAVSDSPMLSGLVSQESTYVSEMVTKKAQEGEPFGRAVSSIAGINRCVRDYNSTREAIYETSMLHYQKAWPENTPLLNMRWGETTTIETMDGQVHLLHMPSKPQALNEISMNLNIDELKAWKATGS